jgi:deoxycytidylate deaminase
LPFTSYLNIGKHSRFLEAAYAVALAGPGVGGRSGKSFRLGAVIVDRRRVLMARHNCLKTHTKLSSYSPWPFLHAESYAILSLGLENCEGKSLYVVRVQRDGKLGIAKPCHSCNRLIKDVGIANVYYSTYEGFDRL